MSSAYIYNWCVEEVLSLMITECFESPQWKCHVLGRHVWVDFSRFAASIRYGDANFFPKITAVERCLSCTVCLVSVPS